jgi:nucleotide-binding universal stress UspA family protein
MLTMNKTLAPVDFSEASAGAARQAAALGRHFHSEIVLLHVRPPG